MFWTPSVDGFILVKKYKVINSPKVCGDHLCSQIDEIKAKKGESSRDIKVCGDRQCNELKIIPYEKTTNQSSPLVQFKIGVVSELIQCKPNLKLVVKSSNNNPACINPKNIQKFIERGWVLPKETKPIFEDNSKSLPKNDLTNIPQSEVYLSISQEMIDGKRYLIFSGFDWIGFHNVEITISDNKRTIDFVQTKTSKSGNLYMPWPIPDSLECGVYSIYATDRIHDFEINIPIISQKQSGK